MNKYYKEIEEKCENISATVESNQAGGLDITFGVSNKKPFFAMDVKMVVNSTDFRSPLKMKNFKEGFSIDVFKAELNPNNKFQTKHCVPAMMEILSKVNPATDKTTVDKIIAEVKVQGKDVLVKDGVVIEPTEFTGLDNIKEVDYDHEVKAEVTMSYDKDASVKEPVPKPAVKKATTKPKTVRKPRKPRAKK